MLSDSTLLLSFIPNLNIKRLKDVYQWFAMTKVTDYGDPTREFSSM